MTNPKLNDVGRAVGKIAADGKVEINATLYEAQTSSTEINDGEEVTVTGWKFDNGVLIVFVRRPGDHTPAKSSEPAGTESIQKPPSEKKSPAPVSATEFKAQLKRLRLQQGILQDQVNILRSRLGVLIGVLIGLGISFLPFGLSFVTETKYGGTQMIHVFIALIKVYSTTGPLGTEIIVKTWVSLTYCGIFGIVGGIIGGQMARPRN